MLHEADNQDGKHAESEAHTLRFMYDQAPKSMRSMVTTLFWRLRGEASSRIEWSWMLGGHKVNS